MSSNLYDNYFKSDTPSEYKASANKIEREFSSLIAKGDIPKCNALLNGLIGAIRRARSEFKMGKVSLIRDLYNKCVFLLKSNKKEKRVENTRRKWAQQKNEEAAKNKQAELELKNKQWVIQETEE